VVKPSIGQTVIHKNYLGKLSAAIIVNVRDDEWVDLYVIPPMNSTYGPHYESHCEHGVTWEWPTILTTTADPIAALPDEDAAQSLPHGWQGGYFGQP